MSPNAPILICGAGISGLALGQALLKASIPFHIFERDATLDVRPQGYRFRLNQDGINALTQLLPPALLARLRASCAHIKSTALSSGFNMLDALTTLPIKTKAPRQDAPQQRQESYSEANSLNVDRSVIRSILILGLEKHISFSKSFSKFSTTANGVEVYFDDGTKVEGALLVGADGVKSKVRKQLLPENRLLDTGARWFFGKTIITPELSERMNTTATAELTIIQDRRKAFPLTCLLEPLRFRDNEYRKNLPADYIFWVLGSMKEYFDVGDEELALDNEEAATETLKLTADWDPEFRVLFEMQDVSKSSFLKTLSARPELPVWESGKVTLVGDAAHAMSPTAGVGAATALKSTALLARVLVERGAGGESLRAYEDEMRGFAGEAVGLSLSRGRLWFGMKEIGELEEVKEW